MSYEALEKRVDELEKRIEIQLGLINHLNRIISDNIINKIEFDVEEAAKRIVAERDGVPDENN
jgi:uncharacterized coiled-coil protein SlyX